MNITIKNAMKRGLIGFLMCETAFATISLITIILSGKPEVVILSNAYITQYICYGLAGFVFSASTVIFEIERLSILGQTVSHFIILYLTQLLVGIKAGWFKNITQLTIIFLIIYSIQFIISYNIYKKQVNELNRSF